MNTRSTPIFKDPTIIKHPFLPHDNYVTVSADKAPNNIVFVCTSHYVDSLIKELGINNSLGNPSYTPTTITKEKILNNRRPVLSSFGISIKDNNWTYHHSTGFLRVFSNSVFVGSAKCSRKRLSTLLTCILSAVKSGLQSIFASQGLRSALLIFTPGIVRWIFEVTRRRFICNAASGSCNQSERALQKAHVL